MPTIVDTYQKDGETINVYESGAHYNVTRGRLVRAPERAMFTPETSRKAKERLAEIKREAVLRGAARALDKSGEWDTPTDMDVVEAIAEAVTIKALNPDNPKQVDAARYIMQEAGLAESQTKSNDLPQQFADIADAAIQILGFLRAEIRPGDVIDVPATDIRNDNNG